VLNFQFLLTTVSQFLPLITYRAVKKQTDISLHILNLDIRLR
jgi:hypothetical protein